MTKLVKRSRPFVVFVIALLMVQIALCDERAIHSKDLSAPITALAFTPDGESVLIGSQAGVEIRSWPTLESQRQVSIDLEQVHDIQFSPSKDQVAIAGGVAGERGLVLVANWPIATEATEVEVSRDVIYRVSWKSDGSQLVTASSTGECAVVDSKRGVVLRRFADHSKSVLAISTELGENRVLSAGADQTLRLWNSQTAEAIRTDDNHLGAINAIAVRRATNRAGPLVVATASDDKTVRFWQPTIGRLLRFARLPARPRALSWIQDGSRLLAACDDGIVRAIDPESAKVVVSFPSPLERIYELVVDDGRQKALVGGVGGLHVISLTRDGVD